MSVPYEQELELYHVGESLCSQKARIGLAEKALPYKSNHTMICDINPNCQNLSPEYLQVNPKGIVPTLVHNGEPVYDAHVIIKYLDDLYPNSGARLWPDEAQLQATARDWFDEGMLKEDVPLGASFGNAIPAISVPILAHTLQRQPLEVVEKNMARHPLKERAEIFLNLRKHGGELPPELLATSLQTLCKGLLRVNRQLAESGGPWLLGDFSMSDITMMACFHRFEDVRLDDIFDEPALPELAAYWQRLQDRPSYTSAVTDWHDEENWRSAIVEVYGSGKSPVLAEMRQTLAAMA